MKKGKKSLSLLLAIALVLTIIPWSWISVSAYDAPVLNSEGYYEISTADHLYWFAEQVNSGNNAINGVMLNDIAVNEEDENPDDYAEIAWISWTPIGDGINCNYEGIFDGAGYTVTNMTCSSAPDVFYVGMFGINAGIIKNLSIDKSYFNAEDDGVGAICHTNTGTIENCHNYCDVTGTGLSDAVGGIASNSSGEIINCSNNGRVLGYENVGGICGVACGTIKKCFNTGSVEGSNNIGGIVGANVFDTDLELSFCYNTGDIVANNIYAGGIGGLGNEIWMLGSCFSTGSVTVRTFDDNTYNGLFGVLTIESCFYANSAYLKDSVKRADGTVGECFAYTTIIEATEEEFENGSVAYFLNGNVVDGTQAWYQNIDNGEPADALPQYTGGTVYENQICTTEGIKKDYSNTLTPIEHNFVNRICTVCGTSLPAETITEENYKVLGLTEEHIGYYAITNSNELYWFADQVNSGNMNINGVLLNNIVVNEGDLSGYDGASENTWKSWNPIGTGELKTSPSYYFVGFEGVFDGNNHIISGLYCDNSETSQESMYSGTGLFGLSKGVIKNLTITNSYFLGLENVGGICGLASGGQILNCYNESTVTALASCAGGVCGESSAVITQCANSGEVLGYEDVGGICGEALENITQSYNVGNVSGDEDVGGICGYIANSKLITSCYNTGTILGTSSAGAIAGGVSSSTTTSEGTIANNFVDCYYLSGSATKTTGEVQTSVGNYIDKEGYALSKTAEQFASGEVAYLLNKGVIDDTQTWYQNIDNGETVDTTPKFTGGTVYKCIHSCSESREHYTNSVDCTGRYHSFDCGTCTECGVNFINPWKSQIRFDKNEDGTFAGTFDYRVLATITSDDFLSVFGSEKNAENTIVEAGFIMARGDTVNDFDYETAKAVAMGTSTVYTKVNVNTISTSFDTDESASAPGDYVMSCIVEDIPEIDKNMCLATMAYIAYNDNNGDLCYVFYPEIHSVCFDGLYEQYYSLAFPS